MADSNKTKSENAGMGTKMSRFLKETKAELKKVTWPTKEQIIHNTGVILVFIIAACVILSLLDFGFQQIMQLLKNL